MSLFKKVVETEKLHLLTGASRTGLTMTLHWRCTLECGHKRLQSSSGRSGPPGKMKCKRCVAAPTTSSRNTGEEKT